MNAKSGTFVILKQLGIAHAHSSEFGVDRTCRLALGRRLGSPNTGRLGCSCPERGLQQRARLGLYAPQTWIIAILHTGMRSRHAILVNQLEMRQSLSISLR